MGGRGSSGGFKYGAGQVLVGDNIGNSLRGEASQYITLKNGYRPQDKYYSVDYDTAYGHVHADFNTQAEAEEYLRRNGVIGRATKSTGGNISVNGVNLKESTPNPYDTSTKIYSTRGYNIVEERGSYRIEDYTQGNKGRPLIITSNSSGRTFKTLDDAAAEIKKRRKRK